MDALILAAGHGTDLNPLTYRRHKHLLSLGNRPALAHMIEALRDSGFRRVGITVNGEEQQYRRLLGDGSYLGVELSYLSEPAPLGTAGCLRSALNGDLQESLLVVNGNLIFSLDLRELVRAHRERRAAATLAVLPDEVSAGARPQRETARVGPDGCVQRMRVDYEPAGACRDHKVAGIYLFERAALEEAIPPEIYYDLKEQLLPALIERGQTVLAHPVRGYLRELNTAEDYLMANFDFCNGRTGAGVGEKLVGGIWFQGRVDLQPDVVVVGPVVLGPGVRVGSGARLVGPLVVGRGAEIGEGTLVRESVVGEEVVTGPRARIERSILADGLRVGERAVIRDSLATSDSLSMGDLTLVERDLRIAVLSLPFLRYLGLGLRRRANEALKRAFDIVLGSLALAVSLPIMAVVAAAIAWDSGLPILFRQKRCGRNGKPFFMLKFRSMRADAETMRPALRNEVDGPVFKIANDPRFTRIGRSLRKYSLDELPQLWNVLRGDMSIVGPRPLQDREMRLSPSWREARLRVKPGLTGLWQVSSREKGRFQHWIQHDLHYVRRQSFLLDLKIVARTILSLAKGL